MKQRNRTSAARSAGVVALGLAASAGHVLYPATLWALTRTRPSAGRREMTAWPSVTVLLPAYREAGVIAAKVDDIRSNGYEGQLEIIVIAEDPETAESARGTGARVLEPESRLGKAQALNLGMAEASHSVAVFSDANNRLEPGAIAALVRRLEEPGVGAVAGEKVEADAGGEELYWRFESWLKKREDDLGTTIGLVGELVAVRVAAWRDIPEDIAMDDLWLALDMAERGLSVAYEPAARSVDPPVTDTDLQWERRTRNLSGALYVFWRKRALLRPGHGVVTLQIVGHKLWRSTLGPVAHVALVVLAVRNMRHSRLAALTVAGHVGAAAALVGRERGLRLPPLLAAPAQVMYLQAVALGGLIRFLRGDRAVKWAKPAR